MSIGLTRPPALLTLNDVAQFLRVSKTTVYRLVERRALPFYRISGVLRFEHADLEAFLRAGRIKPMGPSLQDL